jgi:hypothetical protein
MKRVLIFVCLLLVVITCFAEEIFNRTEFVEQVKSVLAEAFSFAEQWDFTNVIRSQIRIRQLLEIGVRQGFITVSERDEIIHDMYKGEAWGITILRIIDNDTD